MQPDPTNLIRIAGIEIPLIGFYDAPVLPVFGPWIEPSETRISVSSLLSRSGLKARRCICQRRTSDAVGQVATYAELTRGRGKTV
jgi:hypothetical protein